MGRYVAILSMMARSFEQRGASRATIAVLRKCADVERRFGTSDTLDGMSSAYASAMVTVAMNGRPEVIATMIGKLDALRGQLLDVQAGRSPAGMLRAEVEMSRCDSFEAPDLDGAPAGRA